ncbi:S8 family serine peptidase [Thioalkalivibrio sp. XN279]|uniref:S8 family serine peptidase n=1 Tax=Thioalkalivibrio sp. XN279 TaxID=2714953 RepID=UPI0014092B79|nr:S8 family serine peptidase [Thioalkalivibrio sp. XN279]NHA15561.1 S8 family serine peptidase [Thioalkalivibrio sp. XN279]
MKLAPLAVIVSAAVATALSGAPLSHAATTASVNATQISIAQDETPKRWFVELSGPATTQGVTPGAVKNEQAAFRRAAKAAGINFKERFEYQTLWNGFSIEASFADAGKLRAVPGVKNVYPVVDVQAPPRPDPGSKGDVEAAISLTGVDIARSELGLTGEGVKVAIIDTGIDYDHPDLGGDFGPGFKVAYGFDFVGDDYDARFPETSTPAPDDDPDDCNGHGTHVAGIVGAKAAEPDGVTGVAPEVTLGAYRVFGCEGSSSADVIIAALERAYLDGMDVVNQSLGAAYQWPQYPTAVVGDRLVELGVSVIASAGNSGAFGTFSGGAPGIGRDVIGVASYDNAATLSPFFEAGGQNVAYGVMSFSAPAPMSGTEEYVFIGRACDADGDLLADPAGKTALAVRGGCNFAEKAQNAVDASATAVVIYNSSAPLFSGTLGGDPGHDVPVVSISGTDGLFLRGLDSAEITWQEGSARFPNPTGGLISGFSSWGLSPDLELKPDLGAPGGAIFATYPLEFGGYATLSGTSMSAPHVAGAVAMLLEAKPDTPASHIRDILQNTAEPKVWSGNPLSGFLGPVARQGAGMIDIVAAVEGTVRVSPGKLSLGESEAGTHPVSLTVYNSGADDVTLDLEAETAVIGVTRSIPSGPPDNPGATGIGYFLGGSGVAFEAESVTVPAGGSATVNATVFTAPGQDELYGGYITLSGGDTMLRVPYAGYLGDYQLINPLSEDVFDQIVPGRDLVPGLARPTATGWTIYFEGATFTMENEDFPYLLFNVGHHVERLEFQVLDAGTEAPVHPVFSTYFAIDYLGRSSTRQTFFAVPWDGTREHSVGNGDLFKIVPNGDYKMAIRALKANGDPSNPDHWEIWTSPTITIARPEEPKKKTINLRGKGR